MGQLQATDCTGSALWVSHLPYTSRLSRVCFSHDSAKMQKSKFNCTGAFPTFGSIISFNIPLAKVRETQSQGAREHTLPMEVVAMTGTVTSSEQSIEVSSQVLTKCSWSGKDGMKIIGFQGSPRGIHHTSYKSPWGLFSS